MHTCVSPVPTALRVNGPANGLGIDGRPPLLSPSQVSLGPQGQGYRSADLGDSPGKSFTLKTKEKSHIFRSTICYTCSIAQFSVLTLFSVSVFNVQYPLP